MMNSLTAFKFLQAMYFEHKKSKNNSEPQTKNALMRFAGVELNDNIFNETIIFLLHRGLIDIVRRPLTSLGEMEKILESFFIKDYAIGTLDEFFKSEKYKNFEKADAMLAEEAISDGAVFSPDGLNPQEAYRLEKQFLELIKEYFYNLKLNVKNKDVFALYDSAQINHQSPLNPEQATLLNKECYYIHWSFPHNDFNENLELVKEYLKRITKIAA